MTVEVPYPLPRHSRQDIVRGFIELKRSGERCITAEAVIRHLGGSARPQTFVEGVLKVVMAAEGLVERKVIDAISQVSVARLRKECPDLGGNSGSMQEIIDALREATVTVADRESVREEECEEGGEGQPHEDRIGKELVAKIGAQNAMIVAESVRGALAQEREAADQRLQAERMAADRRLQEERAAGDQRLAMAQSSAAAMADRARLDAMTLAEAKIAVARSKGSLRATVVGVIALVGGVAVGAVLAWYQLGGRKPMPMPMEMPVQIHQAAPTAQLDSPDAASAKAKAAQEGGGKNAGELLSATPADAPKSSSPPPAAVNMPAHD